MELGKVYRQSQPVIGHAWRTTGVLERMRGLLGRPPLQPGEALLIEPCNAIHTIGMAYPLDIVFVDAEGTVLKFCQHLPRLRMAKSFGARMTIELAAGEIERIGFSIGDQLQWRPN
jgi:uncharacterized membrane protein (UPF0127 family)